MQRMRELIGAGRIWLAITAWVLLLALFAAAGIAWRYGTLSAELEREAADLHRLVSQRADQHDAHLTSLSALAQAADPPPLEAIEQVAASIRRFYPRIVAIDLVTLTEANPRALLHAGAAEPQWVERTARTAGGPLAAVPVPGQADRLALIKRVPTEGNARYAAVMVIDLHRLVAAEASDRGPLDVALLLDGRPLLAASEPVPSPPMLKPLRFEEALASRTQPLTLRVTRPLRWSELVPWTAIALFGALSAAIAVLAGFVAAARRAAREARMRAGVSEHEARLAHASRVNAMGEFASGIAHELTQPLAAILSQSQAGIRLAGAPVLDRGAVVGVLEANARHAKRAGDILAKLRAWITKAPRVVEVVDVDAVARDVAQLLENDVARARLRLLLVTTPDVAHVAADRVQLEQVLYNLLRNAIDALATRSREGTITLTVQAAANDVNIVIADNGPGVPPDVLPRLFEPFFTTKPDGMGLGLALCATIVERFGGRIEAANRAEGGARFSITLPRAPAASRVEAAE